MNIAWVHNHKYPDYLGGAELSDHYWIKKGRGIGLKIKEFTPGLRFSRHDLYIVGNFGKFDIRFMEKLSKHPYICIVHGKPNDEPFEGFYRNAKLIVYMSPAHHKKYEKSIANSNNIVCTPYVDINKFHDFGLKRVPNSMLYVGSIRLHKGIRILLKHARKNSRLKYHFYGPTKPKELFLLDEIRNTNNCTYHGTLLNEEIPQIMNKYETFITYLDHNINSFQSFERTIVEAILCGMNIETNENDFGLFSYNWNFNNPKSIALEIDNSYSTFWENMIKYGSDHNKNSGT